MSESGIHRIPDGAHRQRADKVLASAFPGKSRSAFQRAFDAGLVTINGKPGSRSAEVGPGDIVEFLFPEVGPPALRPVSIGLSVLYEDSWLIAVDKPSGMVVHPGAATGEDTLVHALLAHCAGSLSGIGGVERPGIVHRLDRGTSGVIVVAKTDAAHQALAAQFAGRTAIKRYLALVAGSPRLESGSVRKPIGRNKIHRHKMAVDEGGRSAWTDWRVLRRFGKAAALVECTLHTGRTHQIRVHLAALGHPLLGDGTYGWKMDPKVPVGPARVMLHSSYLALIHPGTGRKLELSAPLPGDFRTLEAALLKAAAGAEPSRKR